MGFSKGSNVTDGLRRGIDGTNYKMHLMQRMGHTFQPTRGLRQGDPLRLSYLMRLAMREGLLKGEKASRRGLEISHFLFADDCILFSKARNRGALILKEIMKEYERCLGQCVNFNKSTIFYSSNTTEGKKEEILALLSVRSSTNLEKYLGLSTVVELICELKDGVQGYYHKRVRRSSLNQCSRQYQLMLCHAFFYRNLYKTVSLNFGGKKAMGKKEYISASGSICAVQKKMGEWVSEYFLNDDFLNSQLGNTSSYIWRSIWSTKGLCWRVSMGMNVSVNNDAWISDVENLRLSSFVFNMRDSKVAELIDKEDAEKILRIPLAKEPHDDFLVWSGESLGEYSVHSAYKLLRNSGENLRAYALQADYRNFYKKLWLQNLLTKIKITIWRTS
ncbi:reverse transcriptase [Gossypium australe]|uniref:Reverse transcriptase n=1 Tax=Gossypium australe TaxID=47621 RepID=A0A5B6VVQ1_9ROSI|nr:reverse transcriptase [Gossypium australe]